LIDGFDERERDGEREREIVGWKGRPILRKVDIR